MSSSSETKPDRPGLTTCDEDIQLVESILRPGRSNYFLEVERLRARFQRAEFIDDRAEMRAVTQEMIGLAIRLDKIADTFQRAAIALDRAARKAEMIVAK